MQKLAEALLQAKGLVFDFDGTLVDSNLIKWKGFEACFSGFPGRLEEIMAYCRGNSHTPRWDKFRHVYERILRLPYTPEDERRLSRAFEEATTQKIVETPEVPSAERFLRRVASTHWTALLSATPNPILAQILKNRGWGEIFREVQGAPVHKAVWLRELRGRKSWGAAQLLFFGDTPEDAQAAAEADCLFVLVGKTQETPTNTFAIPNYERLVAAIEEGREC